MNAYEMGTGIGTRKGVNAYVAVLVGTGALLTGISLAWLYAEPINQASASVECGSLSRIVARRNQSMLDGASFRTVADHAYSVCLSDPAAFRRLVR